MARRQRWGVKQLEVNVIKPLFPSDSVDIGEDDSGYDFYFRGATSGSYVMWDESADEMIFEGADLNLNDSDHLYFGDDDDVDMRWDGTDMDILPAADNSVLKFGNGTLSFDVWLYGSGAANNIILDASANMLNLDGIDLQLEDSDILEFGDKSGGDVSMRWDGTDFDILAGSDDYVIKFGTGTNSFDIHFFGDSAAKHTVIDASDDSITITGMELIWASGKSGNETMKFADDGASTCADLASAVATVNGVVKVKIGSTTAYIPTYEAFTAA